MPDRPDYFSEMNSVEWEHPTPSLFDHCLSLFGLPSIVDRLTVSRHVSFMFIDI